MNRTVALPDLGLADVRQTLVRWRTDVGRAVVEGDALVSVLAGGVSVDVPSPCCGRVVRRLVAPGSEVRAGQELVVLRPDA